MKNKPIKNKFFTEHDDGSITFNGNLIVSDTPRTDEIEARYDAGQHGAAGMIVFARELERENAALKEALDAQMKYQRELRADRDRMDWLSCHPSIIKHYHENWYWAGEEIATFRAAIDAARKEAKP